MDKIKTGELIREMRIKQELTQNQLADRLGVTNKAVSRWETGSSFPDITLLSQLAEILDVEIEEIVLGEKKEICGNKEVIEAIVDEAKSQKKLNSKKIINIVLWICIIAFAILVIGVIFYFACFALIEEEPNIEEAKLTSAFAFFAFILIVQRFGLPLLGIGITGLLLNDTKRKTRVKKIVLYTILSTCIAWLGYAVAIVIYNMIVWS